MLQKGCILICDTLLCSSSSSNICLVFRVRLDRLDLLENWERKERKYVKIRYPVLKLYLNFYCVKIVLYVILCDIVSLIEVSGTII